MKLFKIILFMILLLVYVGPVRAANITIEIADSPKATSENYAQSLFELGKSNYHSKSFETAISYFLEAERVSSNKTKGKTNRFTAMFKDELWDYQDNYYYLGLAYRDSHNYIDAVKAFEKITKLDKENYDAFLLMGQSYIASEKKSNGSKAVDACKKAVRIKEDLTDGYVCIAQGSMMNNITRGAIKALDKVIELDPGDIPSYKMIIAILESTNKPEDAEPYIERLENIQNN